MNDGATWWYLVVGIAVGIAIAWLVGGRLARDDVVASREERRDEAAWISSTIERHGGVAPQLLVEEVLELHRAWLDGTEPYAAVREETALVGRTGAAASADPRQASPPG